MKKLLAMFLFFAFLLIPMIALSDEIPVWDDEKKVFTYKGEVYESTVPPSAIIWSNVAKEAFYNDRKAIEGFWFRGDELNLPRTIGVFPDKNSPLKGTIYVDKDCDGTFELSFGLTQDVDFVWPDCASGKP